jgi:hypothetical protein
LLLGEIVKSCAFADLVEQALGFGFSGRQAVIGSGCERRSCVGGGSGGRFRRDQKFAQTDLFGLLQFGLMLFVEVLDLVLIEGPAA